jgi:cytochrome b involved in lipid metabolism
MVLLFGCTQNSSQNTAPAEIPTKDNTVVNTTYNISEISTHNSENDCWIAVEGKVYDVTGFISSHPGGQLILQGCGRDATDLFNSKHAVQPNQKYLIGEIE